MTKTLSIRRAGVDDAELMLTLLYELAEYEKLTQRFHITRETIARDFFGPAPAVFCDLAFLEDTAIGLATWYWTYATFATARGLYLEDLYVRVQHRGRGYGKDLLSHLAKQALAHGATHMKWSVLNWNAPSIAFYERLGAKPEKEWTVYALDGSALKGLGT